MERTGQHTGQDGTGLGPMDHKPARQTGRGPEIGSLKLDGSVLGRNGVVGVRKSEGARRWVMQLENGSQEQLAASFVGSVGDGGREGGSEGGRAVIRERIPALCVVSSRVVERRGAYVDDRLLPR